MPASAKESAVCPDKIGPMNSYGLLLFLILVLALVGITYLSAGGDAVAKSFGEAGKLFVFVLPNLILGFTLAGFLMYWLPQELVARWLGAESGFRGILVGWLAGAITPGGPFTHFPILALLMAKGAQAGPVAAYIASWALIGVHRILIWEIPILGWRFVGIRLLASFLFPPLIGLVATQLAEFLGRE